jgi:hypothetical protein
MRGLCGTYRPSGSAGRAWGYRAKTLRINRLVSPIRYRPCRLRMEPWIVRPTRSTMLASLLLTLLLMPGLGFIGGPAQAEPVTNAAVNQHGPALREPDWQQIDWRPGQARRGWHAAQPQFAQRRRRVHAVGRSWHRPGRSWHRRGRSWSERRGTRRPRREHFRGRSWHARNRSWHIRGRSW